jgi:hypothetical protein
MFDGTVRAIVAIVKNKFAQKAPWLAISLGALTALDQGQEPSRTSGEARGRGGLGSLTQKFNSDRQLIISAAQRKMFADTSNDQSRERTMTPETTDAWTGLAKQTAEQITERTHVYTTALAGIGGAKSGT